MGKRKLADRAVHKLPEELRKAIMNDSRARATWEDITPLARNEWICWTISVKKPETKKLHLERLRADLARGKRRPCCWPGCAHRKKKSPYL